MSTNPLINKEMGAKIKTLRILNNLTQDMLSEKIDVSTRFLADVEAGKVGISIETLKKICLALNTSADYLLGLSIDQKSSVYDEAHILIDRIPQYCISDITEIIKHINNISKTTKKE